MVRGLRRPPFRRGTVHGLLRAAEPVAGVFAALYLGLLQDWWLVCPPDVSWFPQEDPWSKEWPWLLAMCLPLLLCRRYPVPVLAVTTVAYVGACFDEVYLVPVAPLLALAVVIIEEASWIVIASATGMMGILFAGLMISVGQFHAAYAVPGYCLAIAVFAGLSFRFRRQRGAARAGESAAAASQAWAEVRLAIARDMHDLVGHGLCAAAVQSSAARMALQSGDVETAVKAIAAAETGSRETLRGLRELLTVLRADPTGEEERRPAPGLGDLPSLVEHVRSSGTWVRLRQNVVDAPGSGVQLCAYRVVQEGLTNAMLHAPGADVDVRVVSGERGLRVIVTNEAARTSQPSVTGVVKRAGLGLQGMRERVEAHGGILESGAHGAGGWRVRAWLPVVKPRC